MGKHENFSGAVLAYTSLSTPHKTYQLENTKSKKPGLLSPVAQLSSTIVKKQGLQGGKMLLVAVVAVGEAVW